MSGLRGFAEDGEREFAAGSVFGVRWWAISPELMTNSIKRLQPEPPPPYDMIHGHHVGQTCPACTRWIPAPGPGATPQAMMNWVQGGYVKHPVARRSLVPDRTPLSGAVGNWEAGVNTAVCVLAWRAGAGRVTGEELHPGSPAPDPDCACGFWAYWELTDAPPGPRDVVGVIEGSGRSAIGEKGFRCRNATIIALHLNGLPARVRREVDPPDFHRWQSEMEDLLSAYYGVRVYASLDAMLGRHPTTKDYAAPAARRVAEERAQRMRHASAELAAILQQVRSPDEQARALAAFASARALDWDQMTALMREATGKMAQFTAAMQANADQVTALYGLPPAILGDTVAAEIRRLRQDRLATWQRCKDLAVGAANRAFTAAEKRDWDMMNNELSRLDAMIRGFGKGIGL